MRRMFGRIAGVAAVVFAAVVVCPLVRSEALKISTAGGFSSARLGGGTAAAVAPNQGSGSPGAQLGVPTAVLGWAELYVGCFSDGGNWTFNTLPRHGQFSTADALGGADACGKPIPYKML